MIERLNSNQIGFSSNPNETFKAFAVTNPTQKQPTKTDTVEIKAQAQSKNAVKIGAEDVGENKGIKGKVKSIKNRFLNFIKGYNVVSNTAFGAVKGVAYGAVAALATGVVGKNIQQSKGQIGETLTGIIHDTGSGLVKVIKSVPDIITKSPLDNIKKIKDAPSAFYKYCASGLEEGAKGSKKVGIIATLAGVGVLGYNVLKGKLKGNHASAEVDHYTNNGHIKT